jgi:sec-independent protein translocase protein TatA
MLGAPEIIVIGLLVIILLFGGKKIAELARSLGKAKGEFAKGKKEAEEELKKEEEKTIQ